MSKPLHNTLWTREFLLLNGVFFLAAVTMSVFFQFHEYLRSMGIDPRWYGLIIGADSIASFFIQPLLSPYLHRENAIRWMAAGIITIMGALFLYGFATTVFPLVAVRILHGAGFVTLIAAMMALIVDYIPLEKSGQAFGLLSVVRLLPYALVPPALAYLIQGPGDFVGLLKYNIVLMAISLAMLLLVKPMPSPDGYSSPEKITYRALFENLKSQGVALLLLINLMLYSGYTIIFFFLKGYGTTIAMKNPGIFFTIATVTMIAVRLLGHLFDKVNKVWVTTCSMAGLMACYMALVHVPAGNPFYALAFFVGLGWGIVMPLLNALMFEVSEPRYRGLNLNLSLVMMQGGFFLGPVLGGSLLAHYGYAPLFYFCAFLSLCSAVLTLPLSPKRRKTNCDE